MSQETDLLMKPTVSEKLVGLDHQVWSAAAGSLVSMLGSSAPFALDIKL